MTECSRCSRGARRVIRPYWDLDAPLCPACTRYVADKHDAMGTWPIEGRQIPAEVAA